MLRYKIAVCGRLGAGFRQPDGFRQLRPFRHDAKTATRPGNTADRHGTSRFIVVVATPEIKQTGAFGIRTGTRFLNTNSARIIACAHRHPGRCGRQQQRNGKQYGKQSLHRGNLRTQKKPTGAIWPYVRVDLTKLYPFVLPSPGTTYSQDRNIHLRYQKCHQKNSPPPIANIASYSSAPAVANTLLPGNFRRANVVRNSSSAPAMQVLLPVDKTCR